MSDLTTKGTPRKREPRPGEGHPRKPRHKTRKQRRVYLSDEELVGLGWDGKQPVGTFLQGHLRPPSRIDQLIALLPPDTPIPYAELLPRLHGEWMLLERAGRLEEALAVRTAWLILRKVAKALPRDRALNTPLEPKE